MRAAILILLLAFVLASVGCSSTKPTTFNVWDHLGGGVEGLPGATASLGEFIGPYDLQGLGETWYHLKNVLH